MYQNYLNQINQLSNELSEKQKKRLKHEELKLLIKKLATLEYDRLTEQMLDDMTVIMKKVTLNKVYTSDFNRTFRKLKMYVQKEYKIQSANQVITESRGAGIAIGIGIGLSLLPALDSGGLAIGLAIGLGVSQFVIKVTYNKLSKLDLLY